MTSASLRVRPEVGPTMISNQVVEYRQACLSAATCLLRHFLRHRQKIGTSDSSSFTSRSNSLFSVAPMWPLYCTLAKGSDGKTAAMPSLAGPINIRQSLRHRCCRALWCIRGAGACTRSRRRSLILAIKHIWDLGDARLAEPDAARFLSEAMG